MTSYTHLNSYIRSHINEPSENRADGKNLIYQIWYVTTTSPHWLIGKFNEYQRLWLMLESTPSWYTDTVLKCFHGENIPGQHKKVTQRWTFLLKEIETCGFLHWVKTQMKILNPENQIFRIFFSIVNKHPNISNEIIAKNKENSDLKLWFFFCL